MSPRSGHILRKLGIRTPEGWLPQQKSSLLAFAHMDAGDRRLLISADDYSNDIKVYDWSSQGHTPDFSEGVMVHTLRGHDSYYQ